MGDELLGEKQSKPTRYDQYVEEMTEDITNTIQEFGVQPILFVGSGLSKRYMGAPSWEELLSHLAEKCSSIDKGLGFYKQSLGHPIQIGQEFSRLYQEWAWGSGHNEFPEEMFGGDTGKHSYIKFKIAELFKSILPDDKIGLNKDYESEISSLCAIKPHSIITTNYDEMLELLFPDYECIVGQKILKAQQFCIGELYKIHGCVTDHDSLVFTQDDYDEWQKKKKFLSAKLLTFFNEHPLIFIGYNAEDPNIKSILSDIDEALPEKGGVIPNVYILQWDPEINKDSRPQRERLIATENDRSIRVKVIVSCNFEWVFDAFAACPVLANINTKVLRALIARSYELVRTDIPNMKVEADFKMLSSAVESSDSFAKLFGIANINDFSAAGAHHPLSLTEVGKALGFNGWHSADAIIHQIEQDKGINIKKSDNRYHRADRINKTVFHKYSDDAIILLKKVMNGDEYELDLGVPEKQS